MVVNGKLNNKKIRYESGIKQIGFKKSTFKNLCYNLVLNQLNKQKSKSLTNGF
jgi:hypothetical protein